MVPTDGVKFTQLLPTDTDDHAAAAAAVVVSDHSNDDATVDMPFLMMIHSPQLLTTSSRSRLW
jgi:hypothetical protein